MFVAMQIKNILRHLTDDLKLLFAGILAIFLATQSQAQFLSGVVTNAQTGEKLPGVAVFDASNKKSSTLTNEKGEYKLQLFTGEYILVFQLIGFKPDTLKVKFDLPGSAKTLNVQLKETVTELKTFVTSASKYEQAIEKITVSMEVLKPNIIENKNTTSLDDALQQVPGVSIVDNEPQIRSGSGFSFGAGSRVMILVDDLPILSGDAGRPSWGFLPVENIEQVEVVKGAASVLYGSAALSGVINIRTAYPKDKPETRINYFSGVYNRPQRRSANWPSSPQLYHNLSFNHTRKFKKWDIVAGGNFFHDDGFKGSTPSFQGISPTTDTTTREYESRARVNVSIRRNVQKVKGLAYGVNLNGMVSNSAATLIWFNNSDQMYRSYPGAITETKQRTYYIDPFVTYQTEKGWSHSLKTRYFYLNNENTNNQSNQSSLLYSEYKLQKLIKLKSERTLLISTGFVNMLSFARSDLYKGELAADTSNKASSDAANRAAFVQLDWNITKKLNLSAGARYEYFLISKPRIGNSPKENFSDQKPVFRAGANYQLFDFTFLRASVGQGFRFPTIGEKYIRTAVGPINIYPSENLLAETSVNYEIGFKQGFAIKGFKGFVDLALFRQDFNNTIEFNFGQWGGLADPLFGLGFRSINIGKTRVSGYEISITGTGKIGKVELMTLVGYTYTLPVTLEPSKVLYETGLNQVSYDSSSSNPKNNILKYRFQHLAKGDVQATYKKWVLGVSVRYNSFMQNIDRLFEELDTFAALGLLAVSPGLTEYRKVNNKGALVFDARLGYQLNSKLRLSLVVNNILNNEYTLRPMVVEQPRTTAIQLSLKF